MAEGGFGIDPAALAPWLADIGVEFSGELRVERIGLGQSNLTFRLTDGAGRRWVLRKPPLGRLLSSAHDVVREARILTALEDTDVPTPRVLGVFLDAGAPLVLMEFVDGVVVDGPAVAEGLSLHRRRAIGLSLGETLARVHAVDLDRAGLADLASRRPYAERQLARWSRQWERSRTRELPALEALTERLRAAIPAQRETTLVHGDFHLRNVITGTDGEVTAVLDWELCTLGDPLADLGTLLAYWPEPGDAVGGELSASVLPGFPHRDEIASGYLDHTGRDPAALGFWHALGLWKVAIIGEGVLRRAIDDPRNRAAAGTATAEQITALIDSATEVADAACV
ncbi:phosphotransferase family protein [Actinokineospora fastidiosa]|uniref:Acyl-CoA dehydrogenase n=1 Tax=Actinokineospora fastidiosa TaxID=1816 RepID=A0A918GMP7_9PSEU|nr:phosphotransferase family protein [Actinokineospora fastidiosa]GGS45650.1 acyl-CoA dehydrogenase [Actinokineospora fastidiosa]